MAAVGWNNTAKSRAAMPRRGRKMAPAAVERPEWGAVAAKAVMVCGVMNRGVTQVSQPAI